MATGSWLSSGPSWLLVSLSLNPSLHRERFSLAALLPHLPASLRTELSGREGSLLLAVIPEQQNRAVLLAGSPQLVQPSLMSHEPPGFQEAEGRVS